MLEQIVRNRKLSATGAPLLTFVWSGCTTAFHYNYEERSFQGLMPEVPALPNQKYPIAFFFLTRCADNSHTSPIELIAVRDFGTTEEQVRVEFQRWNLDEIACERNHPFLIPEPE